MPSNTNRQAHRANQALHAFQAGYDAKQHQPESCDEGSQKRIVTLTHEDCTHLFLVECFPGCYRLCVSDGRFHEHTNCTRVDRADVEDFYYNAYDYTDEDDEVLLYQIMTAIAAIKLFDGMRKFVAWEEV